MGRRDRAIDEIVTTPPVNAQASAAAAAELDEPFEAVEDEEEIAAPESEADSDADEDALESRRGGRRDHCGAGR